MEQKGQRNSLYHQTTGRYALRKGISMITRFKIGFNWMKQNAYFISPR